MRKIIIIFFLLMISFNVYSLDIFKIDYSVELGYVPHGGIGHWEYVKYDDGTSFNEGSYDVFSKTFYTQLETKVWIYNLVYIGGSVTIQEESDLSTDPNDPVPLPNFNPTWTNYNFNIGIKYKMFEIFYSHDCTHPQFTYSYSYRVTSLWGEGFVDRVGIKISGSIK